MADVRIRLEEALGERYRIENELGSGGTGLVFLAEDVKHGRKVAIKVLRPEFAQSLGAERFLQEIRIAAQLSHPNILSLIDSGDADGLLHYVMFYVAGESLRDRLNRERQLPIEDALRITREVADALSYAHEAGVIHRDIKPGNILIEAGHAIVCDFGIAKAISEAASDKLTQSGLAVGTAAYMSPEQAMGEADVDSRTDIYSLACVLYEMLSGENPYAGATPQAILARKAMGSVPSLRILRDTVPEAVEAAITRALARIPADRFATANDFAEALSSDVSSAGIPKPAMPARAKTRRLATVGAATAVLTLAAIGTLVLIIGTESDSAPPLATFTQLTAQPGVEDSPSLSPDGMWVVYSGEGVSGRDIFLRGVGGQRSINLTEDSPDDDTQPVLSPDGERIAFRSSRDGGGLFVMGRTGEAVRRVSDVGFNPAWSPDGNRLVFATESVGLLPLNWDGISQLWTADLATGMVERMFEGDAVQPSWSPSGRRVAFTSRVGSTSEMDIWTMSVGGGEPTAVTRDTPTDWNPTWSPDGEHLYFSSDRGGSMNLWRIPVDEESGEPLGEPEPVTTPSSFAAHPSVSMGGGLVTFTSVLTTQNIQRATLDLATGTLGDSLWLTTGSRQWSSPDPSPDGEWMAFYSRDRPEGDLYVIRRDGTRLRQVTSDLALDRVPRWSPDGQWMAYFSNRSGPLQLWMIRADGSGDRQLTKAERGSIAAWAPDGSSIAVNSAPVESVYIFDPHRDWDEQSPELLPFPHDSIGRFLANSWSPDGRRLAGFLRPLADDGVLLYSFDTREYERLTDYGQWPVWLADNRHLLFVTGGKEFLIIDSETREVRKVLSVTRDVLGPPRVTRDGRMIVYTRRVTESDIWLVTLQ